MIDQAASAVQAGDALPFCFGMAVADRRFYSLEAQAGRASVMILADHRATADPLITIQAFLQHADAFANRNTDLLLLANADVVRPLSDRLSGPPCMRLIDVDNAFLVRCGVKPGEIMILVVDRNRRVALRLAPAEGVHMASACLACIDSMPLETPRDAMLPAPVLMLPHLLPVQLCRYLMTLFEDRPSMEGEIASIDRAGLPQSRVDRAKKSRRDVPIPASDPLYPLLRDTMLRRCAPEMARAFQARITHIDRLLIARYDETGGWFRRHRDNMAENVAFREFAISVNLNTGDFEGGHLNFPEYNDHRYSPSIGGGLIFSASLLHEVAPITRGRRYVLLTFLYGDAAEEQRKAYMRRSLSRDEAAGDSIASRPALAEAAE